MKKVLSTMQNVTAPDRALGRLRLVPRTFFVLLVRAYQLTISPAKTALFGPAGHCRFEPSCSTYASAAIGEHGAMRGSWLAARRLCRCHPWHPGGFDPVPPRR